MPEPKNFEFYVERIEKGILEVLKEPMKNVGVNPSSGFATYWGQIDSPESLKKAIEEQVLTFPCVMVSYAGGENKQDPPTPPVLGRPLHFRHDCDFSVLVADNNPQGEATRRNEQLYKMVSIMLDELTGRRLKTLVEGETEPVDLNTDVFMPMDVIPIRLPDITAYGIPFETAFKWSTPDRATPGTDVNTIVVDLDSLNQAIVPEPSGNLPGVTFKESN